MVLASAEIAVNHPGRDCAPPTVCVVCAETQLRPSRSAVKTKDVFMLSIARAVGEGRYARRSEEEGEDGEFR